MLDIELWSHDLCRWLEGEISMILTKKTYKKVHSSVLFLVKNVIILSTQFLDAPMINEKKVN